MNHEEALYAYNQFIAMADFIEGVEVAIAIDAIDHSQVPGLLECHRANAQRALYACIEYKWEPLRLKILAAIRKLDADIPVIKELVGQLEEERKAN